MIDRVQAGEAFVITRRGKIVARLTAPEGGDGEQQARAAVDRLKACRKDVSLGRPRGRDLIDEGKR